MKKAISKRKAELMEQRVINCDSDQKKLLSLIHSLYKIKMEFPLLVVCLPAYSFVDIGIIMPVCTAIFDTCQTFSCDVLASIFYI